MSIMPGDRSSYDSERYHAQRRRLLELLGGRCAQCGSPEALEFDHIDPSTKSFAVMARWNASDDVLLPELNKCQLLCAACHLRKTVELSSVDHGGGVSGKKNCKCDLCRARKNEYMRAWKMARRKKNPLAA